MHFFPFTVIFPIFFPRVWFCQNYHMQKMFFTPTCLSIFRIFHESLYFLRAKSWDIGFYFTGASSFFTQKKKHQIWARAVLGKLPLVEWCSHILEIYRYFLGKSYLIYHIFGFSIYKVLINQLNISANSGKFILSKKIVLEKIRCTLLTSKFISRKEIFYLKTYVK